MRAISEWLDLVPVNKVLAFGGDYKSETVVLTYGHLDITLHNLTRVLGYRVKEKRIAVDDAVEIMLMCNSFNTNKL